MVCQAEDKDCCIENESGDICCGKESCCANIPVTSSQLNFAVIIGVDKKNEALIAASSIHTFNISQLESTPQLSEGYLTSLIKPPAFT